jgi:hypothetical protein
VFFMLRMRFHFCTLVDQSKLSILRSQFKLVYAQVALDSFGQCNVITVQQYAHAGDSALHNSTPLKRSPLHMYVYVSVFPIGNAFAKHY